MNSQVFEQRIAQVLGNYQWATMKLQAEVEALKAELAKAKTPPVEPPK